MNDPQTILLVDDGENDLLLLRKAFEMSQSKLVLREARNGEETIAYLKGDGQYQSRHDFPMPVAMLLDLNMPRMNGFAVLAWVRAQPRLKRMAIIVLTASTRTQDVEMAFDLGATSFLVKPSNLNTLAAMMRCLSEWIQISHFAALE